MIFKAKVILYRVPDFSYWMARYFGVSGRALGDEQTAMRVDEVSKDEARAQMQAALPQARIIIEGESRLRRFLARITGGRS